MIKVETSRRLGNPLEIRSFIPLQNLKVALAKTCSQYGLPVNVEIDKLKEGGFLSEAVDCVVVYHANHRKDYYSFALTQSEKYGAVYLSIFSAGTSKNERNINAADIMEKDRRINADVYYATHGEFGYSGSGATKTINSWVKKKAEKNAVDEKIYYERMADALLDAVEIALRMPNPAPKAGSSATGAPKTKPASKAYSAPKTGSSATAAPKTEPASKVSSAPKSAFSANATSTPKTVQASSSPMGKATPTRVTNTQENGSNKAAWVYVGWFAMAIVSVFVYGPGALLTGFIGFLLLCWATSLAEKAHLFFGFIVAMIAWMMVCMPLIEHTEALGAILVVVAAILTIVL